MLRFQPIPGVTSSGAINGARLRLQGDRSEERQRVWEESGAFAHSAAGGMGLTAELERGYQLTRLKTLSVLPGRIRSWRLAKMGGLEI